LFGEGVVNDAVAILLFRSVVKNSVTYPHSTTTYLEMSRDFIVLAICSVLIGVIFGLSSALILLKQRFNSSSKECTILFGIAYLSYLIAEAMHLSGIITLFSCGFTMAHYAFHNVSRECQSGSVLAVETLSHISEGFLYVYLGLSSLSIKWHSVNLGLISITIVGTIVGRFVGVMLPMTLMVDCMRCCGNKIKLKERFLLAAGGSVRGAIAFGLAL
jgi:NhaP-type Na+/H+ or K+/H+ antiporter